jgi:hypothetical protein
MPGLLNFFIPSFDIRLVRREQDSMLAGRVQTADRPEEIMSLRPEPIRPGLRYAEVFPDTTDVRFGSDIGELAAFGLAPELLAEWSGRFSGGLSQRPATGSA